MFTVKLYSADGQRSIIEGADSFTILRDAETGEAEITLHRKNAPDRRFDVKPGKPPDDGVAWPSRFAVAYIENATGKTVDVVRLPLPPMATQPAAGRPSR